MNGLDLGLNVSFSGTCDQYVASGNLKRPASVGMYLGNLSDVYEVFLD